MGFNDKFTCSSLRTIYQNKKTIDSSTHQKMMNSFRLYLGLGGSQMLYFYIKKHYPLFVVIVKKDNIKLYQDDLRKHDNICNTYSLSIYQSLLPSLLSWSKRVKTTIKT